VNVPPTSTPRITGWTVSDASSPTAAGRGGNFASAA
jgi:hypothetical protein